MVRRTNWALKGSRARKGWIEEKDETPLEEVDRILAEHEADFIFEEQIRKQNGGNHFEPSSSGTSSSGSSDFSLMDSAEHMPTANPAPLAIGSPQSTFKVLKSRLQSNFRQAWKSRTRKAVEGNAAKSMDLCHPRNLMATGQDTSYTELESNTDFDDFEREEFWAQQGFNEYKITYSDRTCKLSEIGNISPRTIPQDYLS